MMTAAVKPNHRAAFQHHHLLPLALLRRPQFATFLREVRACGVNIHDRQRNCLWLPAQELVAVQLGHALHRGPHPHYSDVVAARVERARARWARSQSPGATMHAAGQLSQLQAVMTRVLVGPGPRLLHLNRRDPMRAFADYSYLDGAISRMFAAPDPAGAGEAAP